MLLDPSVPELIHLVHQPVEEIPVMGNDHQCAVILLQSLFQYILRPDIHMVGRFIKSQKVVRLEHQFRHTETSPLAAAQNSDFLVDVIPPEQECGQYVPQLRPDITRGNTFERLHDRQVLVQDIFLILSEITDVDIVSDLGFSGDWRQLTSHHPHQSGLSLTVPSDQCHFLSPADFNIGIAEHDLARIAYSQIAPLEHYISGTGRRRELHTESGIVSLVYFNAFQLFESLDAGLYLIRFRRLVPELVDEVLCLLDHLLLVLVGCHLLAYPLLPQLQVFRIGNLVIVYVRGHYLDSPVRHSIQETSVVGHEKNGTTIIFQISLEPFDRFNVKMVGRLIQKKDIRSRKQNLRQFDAHVPSLAESLGRPVELAVLEPESEQCPLRLHARRLRMLHSKPVIDFVHPGYQ